MLDFNPTGMLAGIFDSQNFRRFWRDESSDIDFYPSWIIACIFLGLFLLGFAFWAAVIEAVLYLLPLLH